MTILSSVVRKVLAGIAIIGGVVSFITFGIMSGVRLAYADTESDLNDDERPRFMLVLRE